MASTVSWRAGRFVSKGIRYFAHRAPQETQSVAESTGGAEQAGRKEIRLIGASHVVETIERLIPRSRRIIR